MTRFVLVPIHSLAIVATAAVAQAENAPNTLTPAEKAAGWVLLFDGEHTDSWRGYRQASFPPRGWSVEDGCLVVNAGGGGGDIVTRDRYGDFELAFEWKATPGANSGVIYRVSETGDYPWMTGPEFQVLDDSAHQLPPDAPHAAGALYDLAAPSGAKALKPAGEFNSGRIRVEDGRLRHWINGQKVVDVRMDDQSWRDRIDWSKFKSYPGFGVQPEGHIALQDHGDTVSYRNLKVRRLDAPMPDEVVLFNGDGLDAWTAVLPDGATLDQVWSVRDGVLVCKGQPIGYIRTVDDFENYVLKLDWRFNPITGQAGNSGVLLRMIGPDTVWPKSVEAQLHSGNAGDFWNIGDFIMTTDPARTNGRNTRKTHGNENAVGAWNEYEIIVDGDTVVLMVNGEELNRATGVEVIPGKICLQSEGAEIHFRDIRLAPIERGTSKN